MAIGLFTDKSHQPTTDEVLSALGSRRALWEALTSFIEDRYGVRGETIFYGKSYGWTVRYRKSGRALLCAFPRQEGFTVQIVLGQEPAERAMALSISERTRRAVQEAHQYHEGRWIYMPVESQQDLADVQQLLMAKARPARRHGPA